MKLELDNMARFLQMAVDYKKEIGFEGQLLIEPKPKEPTKHQYDFDAQTVMSFFKKYNLDKDFKLNIEANHASLANHTFEHELNMCRINGMLGSVDANRGDDILGWDADHFPPYPTMQIDNLENSKITLWIGTQNLNARSMP